MSALASCILTLAAAAFDPCGCDDERAPFDAARLAPPDVSALVHVEAASAIRAELAGRPIVQWLSEIVRTASVHEAWAGLASATGIDEGRLFDLCFGDSVTLMLREPGQWALVTEMSGRASASLLTPLAGRVREPRHGFAITELPEQAMLIARAGRAVVVGPAAQPELLYEVLPRFNRRELGAGLDGAAGIVRGRTLGAGRIGVYLRHQPPLGGWSAAVADIEGDQLLISHAASFENSPFGHGVTRLRCDFSPVTSFGDTMLLAIMQPMDISDGPLEAFVSATLHEGLISKEMRANLGDRRMLLVGEQDGRALAEPADILATTFVACLELNDPQPAAEQLDRQMLRLTKRINELGHGTFLIDLPGPACLRRDNVREIDLAGAEQWLTGGFPIMKDVSLAWTVAQGPQSAWYVVGSNRGTLDDAVRTLTRPVSRPAPSAPGRDRFVGRYDSCGVGNGLRLGAHLRSWSDEVAEFTDAQHAEEMRGTLRAMSELARGLQRCEWQLARPTANEMLLKVQVTLTPPDSAGK